MPCRRLLIGFATIGLVVSATTARAAEVTVQNDSFVNGGSAVVIGDFVVGEEAGVRLTAPCDGNIVAVQIGWLSQSGGAPQTVQNAIHIYDGSTFPTPGAELELLEGPLLTDGALNEFRFLDKDNTIPLMVPVTTGQQFTVTLEYGEATNVQAGDASVFRDLNGCQSGKNVLFAIPGGWVNFCIFLQGDLVIRAVIDCGELDGACCLPDGSCSIETATDCGSMGGIYRGDLTDCADPNCPQPEGACCFQGGGCLNFTQADCTTATGTWGGPGTNCATYVCFPMGACCLPNGSCMDNTDPNQCASLGGVFQGDGTDCNTPCPEPEGACCLSNGACLLLTEADCGVIPNSAWAGGGTDCTDGDGSGTADDCEAGQTCVGDTNGDGIVNITDVGVLLANFGASVPPGTGGDVSGDGFVNITDLGIVLGDFGCTSP